MRRPAGVTTALGEPGGVAFDPRHAAGGVDGLDEVAVGIVAQPDGDAVGVRHGLDEPAGHVQAGDPVLRVDDLGRDALGARVGEPGRALRRR